MAFFLIIVIISLLSNCRKFDNFWEKGASGSQAPGSSGPVGDISATAPIAGAYVNNTQVSYTLAQTCSSASITWVRTGGAADAGGAPAGTHAQALIAAEMTAGAHNNITLSNNPPLVDGAIYTITFACTDMAMNVLTPVVATGVTYDTTAPVITPGTVTPVTSAIINHTQVSYTVSENCASGNVTWVRTGGAADAGGSPAGTHTQALSGAELTSGAHNNIILGNNPALVDGTIYSVSFNCTDFAGNAAATVTSTNVTYDFTVPVITPASVTPVNGAVVNHTQVSYTVSENCASGSVTWLRTGGAADAGGTPPGTHIQALTGTELNAGAHNNITLTNNPVLASGAIYTVSFNCTDAAGQAATVVSSTSVTYDNTAPTISAVSPANSAFVSTTQVSYTFSEACATASITWTRTGGTADGGGTPPGTHAQTLTAPELTATAHNNIIISNNPTLVDGAIYSIAFNCSDAAGNAAPTITRTGVTFDPSAVVISAVAPAGSTFRNNRQVSYTLSENCASASVTWTRTGGAADAGGTPPGTHVQALTGAELTAGAHGPSLLTNDPPLVDGTIYSVQFDCTDSALNASTPIISTNVTYDFTAPIISAVTPAASAIVNNQQVGYNFSEACATATVTWTYVSGPASGNFNQGLTGAELTSGSHGPFIITNNPTLVSGTVYNIAFNCTDAAGNTAAPITRTNVTFDNTPPTVGIQNLKNNSEIRTGHIIGPAADNVNIAQVEFNLDNTTWNAATYAAGSWKFALPMGGATWKDRSIHGIQVRATDTAGNVSAIASVSTVRKCTNRDINGDGYEDFVVGASSYTTSTGRAYVFYGGPAGITATNATMADTNRTGAATNNSFGRSIVMADFNGDGLGDVAIAASMNTSDRGLVYIYPGTAGGLSGTATQISGETTPTATSRFGALLAAGDANNDGYADLVVSANQHNTNTGKAYIFYGGGGGITGGVANTANQMFTGETTADEFGSSLALGDFNGDTFTDLAVGAARPTGKGRVYIFYGTGAGITGTAATPALAIGTGENNSDSYGGGSAVGDINGDGLSDLAVGAFAYSAAGNTGRLYVYYGSGGGIPANMTLNPGSPGTTLTGTNAGAFFTTNTAVSDLDSNGYADIIVGAYGCTSNPQGCAYVFSGQAATIPSGVASTAGYLAFGTTSGENFGRAVSGADVNGDGFPDLIVGANLLTTSTGRVGIYHSTGSGPSGVQTSSILGEVTNSQFGIHINR